MKIIGVAGGSGTGKTTLSKRLFELLPNSLLITGDTILIDEMVKLEEKSLQELGLKKDKNIDSLNHYHASLENLKTWISVVESNVVSRMKDTIKNEGKDKDYIILDWCFLPLCKSIDFCNTTICVTANFDTRLVRLIARLKDPTTPGSYEIYKPGVLEKRVKYTAFNEIGYKFDHYVSNNGNLEEYYSNIDKLTKKIMFDFKN